jgi:amidase
MSFAEYERYDGLGLAELVRDRQVAAGELVEAALARIEARNPALNAVVHTMAEQARAEASGEGAGPSGESSLGAAGQPSPGPFAGVPLVLKDLMAAVAGEPLTSSCRFLANYVPDHDSELVRRLRRAGFVFVGKTNTPEFGIMAVTEPRFRGPARNPWDTDRTPGGSSGGSAAAVAAGITPLAHGGDGGGSIRIPASCCGLFGLKPSRGRVPLGPDFGEAWGGFVQEHVLTRSVRDSAAVLDATAGADESAPYAAPPAARSFLSAVTADPGRLRVAFTSEPFFGRSTHAECRAAVEDAAKLCESLGHEVQEATPRFDKAAARRAFMVVVAAGVARDVARAGELMGQGPTKAGFEPATWFLRSAGRRLSAEDYEAALDTAHEVRRSFAAFFADFDILLTPTLPQPPVAVGALQPHGLDAASLRVLPYLPLGPALQPLLVKFATDTWEAMGNTMVFNQTGQPAMSVPLAWSTGGLPIGLQFAARYGEEATLFSLAGQLETARPWAQRRPPRFSDTAAG